jgi:hypothetical protein
MRAKIGIISVLVVLGVLMSSGLVAASPTKIVPIDGADPGHPFTLIDTGERRLTDGCQAVFRLGGSETVVDLRTHKPYNTANGIVPDIGGGDYAVSVRQPSGTEFEIGLFTVTGEPTPMEPYVEPTPMSRNQYFTLIDPQGRMDPGDELRLIPLNSGWDSGTVPEELIISPDGTTATAFVSQLMAPGDYTIEVREPGAPVPVFLPVPVTIN